MSGVKVWLIGSACCEIPKKALFPSVGWWVWALLTEEATVVSHLWWAGEREADITRVFLMKSSHLSLGGKNFLKQFQAAEIMLGVSG